MQKLSVRYCCLQSKHKNKSDKADIAHNVPSNLKSKKYLDVNTIKENWTKIGAFGENAATAQQIRTLHCE